MEQSIKIRGNVKFTIRNAKTGKIKRVHKYNNLTTTVGRTMLANNLASNSPDNTPVVTHIALGDDNTAPVVGNTTLNSEVYRNAVASLTNANNITYITGFFSATEDDDQYYEAGVFCDGTGAADSGVLFSHVAIDINKSNTETLTVDWTITLSDA